MKWKIPAKTFLVGEYLALTKGPAILLTTKPYFEVKLLEEKCLRNINQNSPAGKYWQCNGSKEYGLEFYDPYHGVGGVGASSAQFLGALLASWHFKGENPSQTDILNTYQEFAYNGKGVMPSGYDVLTQNMRDCVYLNHGLEIYENYAWPFKSISFILVHTKNKLATHEH